MEPGAGAADPGARSELALDRVQEHGTPRGGPDARAARVALQVSAGDEVGERELLERRRAGVGQRLRVEKVRRQRRRRHEPADPEGGKEELRGRAGVDDASCAIQRLEAGKRLRVEAELAVVVVLQHVGAGACRPVEQREAAGQREHAACGILMRGRDAREPCVPHAREHIRPESRVVDGHVFDRGSRGLETDGEAGVVRLLEDDAGAGIDEQSCRQVDRLLRAVHDDDLLRRADDASRAGEIPRECLAQLGRSAGGLIGEPPRREAARTASEHPCPCLERQVRERRLAVAEVVGQGAGPRAPGRASGRHGFGETSGDRRQRRRRCPLVEAEPGGKMGRRGARGQLVDHEESGARARCGVALREQLLAGQEHRVP